MQVEKELVNRVIDETMKELSNKYQWSPEIIKKFETLYLSNELKNANKLCDLFKEEAKKGEARD